MTQTTTADGVRTAHISSGDAEHLGGVYSAAFDDELVRLGFDLRAAGLDRPIRITSGAGDDAGGVTVTQPLAS